MKQDESAKDVYEKIVDGEKKAEPAEPQKKEVRELKGLFCYDCKGLVRQIRDGDKQFLYCAPCDQKYVSAGANKSLVSRSSSMDRSREGLVISQGMAAPPDAFVEAYHCENPKGCNGTEALTWSRQIGHADEEPHIFYRCTTCGYTDKHGWQL